MNVLVIVLSVCVTLILGDKSYTSLDDILDQVVVETDLDGDNEITIAEFQQLLLGWDVNGDYVVTKSEFFDTWIPTYGDSKSGTTRFFNNIDIMKPTLVLNENDILAHVALGTLYYDPIAMSISVADFRAFIHLMHPSGI